MSGSESDCASSQSMEQELLDQVPEGELSEAHADPAPAMDKEPSGGCGGAAKGKAKKQRLTEIQKLDVCDFLRERPHIYNKSHCDFKNKSLKDREWSLLAQRLKADVSCITTWYQSMRTILARTKKQKEKSGSGTGKLTHVQQWVWDHMTFLLTHIETAVPQTLGGKRRLVVDPDTDLGPDQPGPSWREPKSVGIASTSTLRKAAATPSSSDCCEQMRQELYKYTQRAEHPQSHYWGYTEWRTSTMTPSQRLAFHDEVYQVMLRHTACIPIPDQPPYPQRGPIYLLDSG